MAHLHVKTPNGTAYSIDLDAASQIGSVNSGNNGWGVLTNGAILQWGMMEHSNYTDLTFTATFPTTFNTIFAFYLYRAWTEEVSQPYSSGYLATYRVENGQWTDFLTNSGFSLYFKGLKNYWLAIGV